MPRWLIPIVPWARHPYASIWRRPATDCCSRGRPRIPPKPVSHMVRWKKVNGRRKRSWKPKAPGPSPSAADEWRMALGSLPVWNQQLWADLAGEKWWTKTHVGNRDQCLSNGPSHESLIRQANRGICVEPLGTRLVFRWSLQKSRPNPHVLREQFLLGAHASATFVRVMFSCVHDFNTCFNHGRKIRTNVPLLSVKQKDPSETKGCNYQGLGGEAG